MEKLVKKKLALTKETVLDLEASKLAQILGGLEESNTTTAIC